MGTGNSADDTQFGLTRRGFLGATAAAVASAQVVGSPAATASSSAAVRRFRINVRQHVLDDLHTRLTRTLLPGTVDGVGWDYGSDVNYLRSLTAYWRDQFDWRAAEERLNAMPQFTTTVDGFTLHFVHARGRGPAPLPLMFTHGWPGSFWEVHKILGPLTDPGRYGGDPADAFDVVAPSIPGYGFSPDPGIAGIGPIAIAELFRKLMTDKIGYQRFGMQGGDWGSDISSRLAFAHPEQVIGLHINGPGSFPYAGEGAPPLSEAEQKFLAEVQQFFETRGSYYALQAEAPQSLAFGLADSPAGLAAWLVWKFREWSDNGGDIENVFSKDELLTNIMIYWVTGSIDSSVRLYRESVRENSLYFGPGERINVPTGFAILSGDIVVPPREWVDRLYDVRRFTQFDGGGHFAALERPEALVEDIRAFFRPLRS